jgi:uncharacterized protein YggU (UPF0235/DUF167 family)
MPPDRSRDESALAVKVHPRSSKERIAFSDEGVLHAWVAPAAVDGAANQALIRLLAEVLDLAPSRITIQSGLTSRSKRVRISLSESEIAGRLRSALDR